MNISTGEGNMEALQTQELLLDNIYNANDPAVKNFLNQAMFEEMEAAHERALMRVATQFRHLLPPDMQQVLAARQAAPHAFAL